MSIEVRNIDKRFGNFHALRNVNLNIASGELVAMGPSYALRIADFHNPNKD